MDKYEIINEATHIKLKPDNGATRDSLENARRIKDAGYSLYGGTFFGDSNKANYELTVLFVRDKSIEQHTFKGFSVGYTGEGPHGFLEFAEMFGLKLNKNKILGGYYIENDEKRLVNLNYFKL